MYPHGSVIHKACIPISHVLTEIRKYSNSIEQNYTTERRVCRSRKET